MTGVVLAQESSPSTDIQAKVEALKEEIASKAAALKTEVNQKLQNRLITGLVQSQTDSQIAISGEDKSQTVLINKFTQYQYLDNLPQKISKDDFVDVLGDFDDKGNLNAKEIVKQKAPDNTPVAYLWGLAKEASASGIVLQSDGKDQNINLTKDTDLKSLDNSAISEISNGSTVIVISIPDKAGMEKARTIYLVSKPSSSPTPASSSATTSGTKK